MKLGWVMAAHGCPAVNSSLLLLLGSLADIHRDKVLGSQVALHKQQQL